jgi:hypothetical protein
MGEPRFAFPVNVKEAVDLLNDPDRDWSSTVMMKDETLYVFGGDQVMFVANTRQEVLDFLAGMFLATFHGEDLNEIRSERARRNLGPDHELEEIRTGLARHSNLQLVE